MHHRSLPLATARYRQEWFHAEAVASGALDADVMRNFRSFSMANRFRKAALTAVAYQLTEEEQKDLREAWAQKHDVFPWSLKTHAVFFFEESPFGKCSTRFWVPRVSMTLEKWVHDP